MGSPSSHDPRYPQKTYGEISRDILRTVEPPSFLFLVAYAFVIAGVLAGALAWAYQIRTGMGVSGKTHPAGWNAYITTFVFWVGIAHAGTLISAILFLLRAPFRNAIYRASEAMTVFAVATAGLFPLIHLGRVWYFYWLIPYPNQRQLWVNFRSPLIWDVFAVGTYATISTIFFFVGLIPDIATARDRAKSLFRKILYTILSFGWTGSQRQWHHYMSAYTFFAAFATPLVVSVHSVVSWDFAMGIVPGWHTTIFPPYFVAGAIFSGIAMVITIMYPMRKLFHLEEYVTPYHFESMGKILLFTSCIVGYAYAVEFFTAWYSGNPYEWDQFLYRATGHYAWAYWIMVFCNVIAPLPLWIKKVRTNLPVLWVISILVNIGMWFERYNIIVQSLTHEFIPYAFGFNRPSLVEMTIVFGSFCWFFALFLLFAKLLPSLALTELKEVAPRPLRHTLKEPPQTRSEGV
jgi:molybdopterin-containing oxidoreductase family membrane subunit